MNNIYFGNTYRKFWVIVLLLASYEYSFSQKNIDFQIASTNDSIFHSEITFSKFLPSTIEKNKYYWLKFDLENPSIHDQTFVLHTTNKWGEARLIVLKDSSNLISGSLLPLEKRSYKHSITALRFFLEKHKKQTYLLRLKGVVSIYTPKEIDLKISTLEEFQQHDSLRFWFQGIFFGIIIIMALYNFVIYVSVRDISYLFHVISILGIGLYFFFYYGFGIEMLWQNSPKWDTYAFAFIVPLTNLSRIFFTKSYLNLRETYPLLNKSLNLFIFLCLLIMGLAVVSWVGDIDWFDLLIDLVGFLGTSVLTMMLVSGIFVARKGYSPAIYFSVANLILVLGGNLFIIRELGWIDDNIFTRYGVQFGVLAQVVLFSLGLSNRLNQAQLKVAQLELEKERERKQILEEQSQLLQQKVAEQTADLRELNRLKDKLLSMISHDLRNPLASLDSFMNLLINHQDKLSEQEQTTLAQKAKQSLANLNQLLSNLLLWSRSQMNQISFSPKSLDIQCIIEENVKLESLDAQLKNIKITSIVEPNLRFYGDAEMIDFIVRNLLGNAIKFSHKNSEIYLNFTKQSNGFVFEVKDFGVGISAEQIQKIFTQKSITSTRGTAKEKGSGLGLVLCKEFVELHGGKMEIISSDFTQVICFFP